MAVLRAYRNEEGDRPLTPRRTRQTVNRQQLLMLALMLNLLGLIWAAYKAGLLPHVPRP